MTLRQLSPRSEFTPVHTHGSIFVYMIPPQNVMPVRVTLARVHPGSCMKSKSHPGVKLVPVRVFSSKHPLKQQYPYKTNCLQ